MGKVNRKFYGLSQYRGPLCYELAGKKFRLVMDDGRVFGLGFLEINNQITGLIFFKEYNTEMGKNNLNDELE